MLFDFDFTRPLLFDYPWMFALVLLLCPIIYWYAISYRRKSASMKISTTYFLEGYLTHWRHYLRHIPFVFRCFTILAIVTTLARPQEHFTETQTDGEGVDIILCIDISGSMTERDVKPTRIEAAKEIAKDFVRKRPGDRIGVVIFSSVSFTLCPITADHRTVIAQIDRISNGYLQEDGTAIGSGLATSVDRLKNSTVKNKIIVLLTDGIDFGGSIPPSTARNIAKQYGIRVYTIGVGLSIDRTTLHNNEQSITKRDAGFFNENELSNLATETGGKYYHAVDKNTLHNIYNSINQLEKSKINISIYNRYTERFLPFLEIALLALLIEVSLNLIVFKKFP